MRNDKCSFIKIVDWINNQDANGGYWLPNIQRHFVWKEEQIERLFDSILRDYPIGNLLVWRTKSKIRNRKFIKTFDKDSRYDKFELESDLPKNLVLDGQQRLQSLYIGLKGRYNQKELFFDVLSGDIVAPEDIRFKFKFLHPKDAGFPWVNLKKVVFSKKELNEITDDVIDGFREKVDESKRKKVATNVSRLIKRFCIEENLLYQVVDDIDNPELYHEDDIVEIFIRANSGGTPLSKSDLLFSLLTATWDESEEEMNELLSELNLTGYKFNRDLVLKACLCIFKKGASYDVKKFRDSHLQEEISQNWSEISSAIRDVKDFIYSKTFIKTNHSIPSYLTLIPIIYFRYHYKEKWANVEGIQQYLIRTLMAGAFGGSPDSLLDRCNKKIDEDEAFLCDHLFSVIRESGRNLDVSKESLLSAAYGSKEIHLLFNHWYDFNYIPSYEDNKPHVDHIFPQSVLKKVKLDNPKTGRKDITKFPKDIRDQLANCMLLTARENGGSGKRDILPEEWFKGKSEAYLELHLIPKNPELWKLDNFELFIEERKKLLLNKFSDWLIR